MALLSFTFLIGPWRLHFTVNKIYVIWLFCFFSSIISIIPSHLVLFEWSWMEICWAQSIVYAPFVGLQASVADHFCLFSHRICIWMSCSDISSACLTSVYWHVFLAISSKHVCIIKALVPNNDGLSCMYVLWIHPMNQLPA
jgi:hypothetical protein